jgi:heme exporter protein C
VLNWLHRLGAPKSFYRISGHLLPWFSVLACLLLVVGTVWGLLFAPPDYQQGDSFRIIYIHVPSSILAESCYMLMAAAGGIYLVWRIKLADIALMCAAPIGASVTFMALATGSIWGRPTWGTWWVWDARLTSTLVLFFLYIGVIALRSAMENRESAGRATAVLSLVGVINLPIIKYSVDWWNTLHQPSTFTITHAPPMPASMWLPLLIMVIGYYLFFFAVLMMRMRAEIIERENRTEWVRSLVTAQ